MPLPPPYAIFIIWRHYLFMAPLIDDATLPFTPLLFSHATPLSRHAAIFAPRCRRHWLPFTIMSPRHITPTYAITMLIGAIIDTPPWPPSLSYLAHGGAHYINTGFTATPPLSFSSLFSPPRHTHFFGW
jgi:hypothetical protein